MVFKKCSFAVVLFLCAASVFADKSFTELGTLKAGVRQQLKVWDVNTLPDSTLTAICARALVDVSVTCGGVEMQFRVVTDSGDAFYPMPDSVTEILFATLVSRERTMSIKAIPPQFTEDVSPDYPIRLEGQDEYQVPRFYNYWADTLQLISVPSKIDTLYFKCFVEHPLLSADSQDVRLRSTFGEVAFLKSCADAAASFEAFDVSTWYLNEYEKKCPKIREKYLRRFDVLGTK